MQRLQQCFYNARVKQRDFATFYNACVQCAGIEIQQRSVYNACVQQCNVYNNVFTMRAYNNATLQRFTTRVYNARV